MEETEVLSYNSKSARVAARLTEDVRQGKFNAEMMLPMEKDLARAYEVSPRTMRKTLNALAQTGNIIRLAKRGTFVPVKVDANSTLEAKGTSKTGRKIGIAAIWAAMADYPAMKIFGGMKKYAEAHQLNFTNYLSNRHEEILDILDRMENYPAEGVFVCPYYTKEYNVVLGGLVKKGFPLVGMRPMADCSINTVMSNDALEAYQATHYLIEKYRRPVYYLCEPTEGELALDRHTGYNNAMVDAGFERQLEQYTCRMAVPDSDSEYWDARNKWVPGYLAGKILLERIECPASIYCVNDWAAKGIYEAAGERGLVIGKDLMVVGTDDLPFAGLLKPGLTSVRPDVERIGFEAAKLLHHLITGKTQPPIHIRLPVELVVRESA
jgi:DNA-binding LacI/PurR family transcriptional regulator